MYVIAANDTHLEHETPIRPYIALLGLLCTFQDLRTGPPHGSSPRIRAGGYASRVFHESSQAEVTENGSTSVIDEPYEGVILQRAGGQATHERANDMKISYPFDVAMADVVLMKVLQTLQSIRSLDDQLFRQCEGAIRGRSLTSSSRSTTGGFFFVM